MTPKPHPLDPAAAPPAAAGGVPSSSDRVALTRLLHAAAAGEPSAPSELLPLVYAQLRAIAQQRMAGERGGLGGGRAHTLQATALVHEAYLRLVGPGEGGATPKFDGRGHFFAAAAMAMQRILIEHARARMRVKRGGAGVTPAGAGGRAGGRVPMGDVIDLVAAAEEEPEQIVSLDDALRRLEGQDAELAQIVRLRYYGGLSIEETAAALGMSTATLKRRWAFARAWLYQALTAKEEANEPSARQSGDQS